MDEGLSRAVIEAMSSGLPTFATCYGGPLEIIQDGVSGFHLDPNRGDYKGTVNNCASGSSIMPQKRNPDVFELIRGRWFEPGDEALSRDPVVLTQNYAELLFGADDPVDKIVPVYSQDIEAAKALLAEAGVDSSVGSVGDSYDNALAESIIGLFKTEVIRRLGPWRNVEDVEFATLEWVWWFNYHRLLGPIGHLPPAEYEELYYEHQEGQTEEAGLKENSLR